MLARTYLNAEQLGIPERARHALQLTLEAFERGEMQHVNVLAFADAIDQSLDKRFSGMFNMAVWSCATSCGSVGCIGGTAELLGKLSHGELSELAENHPALRALFYPMNWQAPLDTIKLKRAESKLRQYLTTGRVDWSTS